MQLPTNPENFVRIAYGTHPVGPLHSDIAF